MWLACSKDNINLIQDNVLDYFASVQSQHVLLWIDIELSSAKL